MERHVQWTGNFKNRVGGTKGDGKKRKRQPGGKWTYQVPEGRYQKEGRETALSNTTH